MKRNLLKILLALVMVSLVFALVACGGENNTDKDTCKKHVDENNDGKCDKCKADIPGWEDPNAGGDASLSEELTKILNTLNPYLTAVKEIKKDSAVGLDIGIGGYFSIKDEQDKETEGKAMINLAANASKDAPELALGIAVNEEDYFKLGYKDAKVYLLQPLTSINTENIVDKVEIDVSYFEKSIKSVVAYGMTKLEELAGSDALASLDLSELATSLVGGTDENGETVPGLLDMVKSLFKVKSEDNQATITVTEESVNSLVGMLPTILGDNWTKVKGTIDTVLGYVDDVFPDVEAIKDLTFDKIMSNYTPSLNIIAGYDDGAIKNLKVAIGIDALKLETGINIDLNTLSLEDKANIEFKDYKDDNLVLGADINLEEKGLDAEGTVILNTKDGFKELNKSIASASIKLGDNGNSTADAVKCSFDGKTVVLDMTGAFTALGVENKPQTKFYYTREENIKETFNNWLGGIGKETPSNAGDASATEPGFIEIAYDFVADFFGIEAKDRATTKDIGAIVNLVLDNKDNLGKAIYNVDLGEATKNKKLGEFIKVELINEKEDSKTFEEILADIVAKHNANKAILNAGTNVSKNDGINEAGAQLFKAGEDNDMLDYVSKFIKIPAINETGDAFDWETEAQINDAETLKKYVELAFNQYGGKHTNIVNKDLVEKIVGVSYGTIIDSGIYAYARYAEGEGLKGFIGLRPDAVIEETTKVYAQLGASFGFKTLEANNYVPENIDSSYVLFTAVTEGAQVNDDNYYVVFGTMWDLLNAFLNYKQA